MADEEDYLIAVSRLEEDLPSVSLEDVVKRLQRIQSSKFKTQS